MYCKEFLSSRQSELNGLRVENVIIIFHAVNLPKHLQLSIKFHIIFHDEEFPPKEGDAEGIRSSSMSEIGNFLALLRLQLMI